MSDKCVNDQQVLHVLYQQGWIRSMAQAQFPRAERGNGKAIRPTGPGLSLSFISYKSILEHKILFPKQKPTTAWLVTLSPARPPVP